MDIFDENFKNNNNLKSTVSRVPKTDLSYWSLSLEKSKMFINGGNVVMVL